MEFSDVFRLLLQVPLEGSGRQVVLDSPASKERPASRAQEVLTAGLAAPAVTV